MYQSMTPSTKTSIYYPISLWVFSGLILALLFIVVTPTYAEQCRLCRHDLRSPLGSNSRTIIFCTNEEGHMTVLKRFTAAGHG